MSTLKFVAVLVVGVFLGLMVNGLVHEYRHKVVAEGFGCDSEIRPYPVDGGLDSGYMHTVSKCNWVAMGPEKTEEYFEAQDYVHSPRNLWLWVEKILGVLVAVFFVKWANQKYN